MPILVGGNAITPPTTPPSAGADGRRPLAVSYIDPDGQVWNWSSPLSDVMLTSITGLGSPPAAMSGIALPGGGQIPQAYGAAPRNMVVGLDVCDEESQDGLLDTIDQLSVAFWGERYGRPATGTLIVSRPDGSARQIQVLCTSGPEQPDTGSSDDGYQWSTNFALTFVSALDPYFSDSAATELEFAAAGGGSGVPPMPPVLLQASTTLGAATVTNSGSGAAYPIWTVYGPGTPTISLDTPDLSFSLDVVLGVGDVRVIDTRPGLQSVVDGSGANCWAELAAGSPRDLWALPPGSSDISVEIAASTAASKVVLQYVRRWLRA